jgi:hypothetical protein
MYRIRARVPGLKGIYLSRLHLDYHTRLAGKPAEPKYFRINNLYAYVNGAALRGRVRVPLRNNMPAGRVYAKITLNNLRPERFVSAGAKGPVNFSLVSRSRRGLRDLTTKIRVNLNRFVYTLDNSQSRPMYIKVFADIGTSITHNMKHINVDLQKAGLRLLSLRQKPAVKLDLDGKVALRQGAGQRIWGSIYLRKLFFDQMNLYDTMPDALRGGARRNEQPLKDPVTMDGGVHFRMAGQHIRSHGDFGIKVPTFDVEDLKVAYKIHMDQRRNIIRIHKATVGSKSKHLSAKTHGKLAPRRVYDAAKRKYVTKAVPDIKAKVSLVSPKKGDGYSTFTVFRPPGGAPINIGGSIVLKAHVDDQNVSGSLDIRRFQFNDSGYTQVKNMNMHFPFALQLDYKKNISKLETGQAEVISNFHFSEKPNFTIESVSAKHPARDKSYTYMKDFQALMFVRDNTFELKKLQARVLDGQLIGKDTLFYLGNLDPKKMQYQLKLNLINIDMAALDQTLVKKQQEGGLLSAFVNLSGQDPAAADPRGYIIVNKIGPDIAKEVMEALNEKEGESKLGIAQPIVDRSTIPKSFEFRLGDGNIYTTVKFRRGAFSTVADLHPSELKYSRIPIQEFITGLQ